MGFVVVIYIGFKFNVVVIVKECGRYVEVIGIRFIIKYLILMV